MHAAFFLNVFNQGKLLHNPFCVCVFVRMHGLYSMQNGRSREQKTNQTTDFERGRRAAKRTADRENKRWRERRHETVEKERRQRKNNQVVNESHSNELKLLKCKQRKYCRRMPILMHI